MKSVSPPYYSQRDGAHYAGVHLLVDLHGAQRLDDPAHVGQVLVQAARDAGCTILHQHFHHFGAGTGVTGVLLLAESHISIHTWPETGYAAVDVFMCGRCNPHDALPALREGFAVADMAVQEMLRGAHGR
jgi:S-adenosylmethionine decarboxylase